MAGKGGRSSLMSRRRLIRSLNWSLLTEIGAVEVYRAQGERTGDPSLAKLLRDVGGDEADHAEELRQLIARYGGRPWPLAAPTRWASRGLGWLTALFPDRAFLRFDLALERRGVRIYQAALDLMDADDWAGRVRVEAMRRKEQGHEKVLADALVALGRRPPRGPKGRR